MSNLSDYSEIGLTFQGVYSNIVTYKRNNVVTHDAKTYVCTALTSIGSTPGVGADWSVLAESSTITTANTGTGTDPTNFVLSAVGGTITLDKGL